MQVDSLNFRITTASKVKNVEHILFYRQHTLYLGISMDVNKSRNNNLLTKFS
ncbi:hypothetical protein RhiirA5_437976 [Rhizophagus irregularis]|uniref:Uncharacterized protein n=2 Tax=Rhizophagus irregularis TaxID=588596 RepID=A0A2N0NJS9_9GLOM|nr:hypothetical protein RhiirA5_437976 [Rhizophagus irregularis]PKC53481.1 hypothetical protein RhiirA1_479203 [Rhizophagus irregularis]GBC31841.1 hypothetical protein RIR_e70468_A0A2N0NJS9_9GLOM [Rhizophagus irregularis DAOM 181602=DAOM 197198]